MPRLGSAARGYGAAHRRARRAILGPAGGGDLPFDPPCHWRGPRCTGVATTADHDPPLATTGRPHQELVPSCGPCNFGRRPAKRPTATPSRSW